jgi:hypothetical protein
VGLEHDPDLGRVRVHGEDPSQQCLHCGRGVLDPDDLMDSLVRCAQRDQVKLLGPVDANGQHLASLPLVEPSERRGAVLMDQSSRDDTLVSVGPPGPAPWDAVSSQSSRDKPGKHSQGATHDTGG